MNSAVPLKLLAWVVALALVALPIVGVLNGWFASDRWPVTKLAVRAEFDHVSAEQIRAAAQPLLGQGFFAIDLDRVRGAVAKLPWVERAEARKRWPDTIDLVVYEQQAYARWGADRLINRHGRIFSVAGADALQNLPRLAGPDDRLGDVLRFYADCLREFSGSGLVIDALTLSRRGGWRVDLASGAVIEIGRENAAQHLQRFLDVWPRLASAHPGPPAYIDLRYENGFALRWAEAPQAPANRESDRAGRMPERTAKLARRASRGSGDSTGKRHSRSVDSELVATIPMPFGKEIFDNPLRTDAGFRFPALAIPDSRFPIPGP